MVRKYRIQLTNEHGEVERYATATAFASAHQLSIPSVTLWLRQGLTAKEILLRTKGRARKRTAQSAVSYQGVSYPSLSAAGTALGVTPTQLYQTRKKLKKSNPDCSDSEVLAYVCARRQGKKEPFGQGMSKPFAFLGVQYASRAEALNAYQLPRVSVDTVLRRNPGLTDAEAMLHCISSRRMREKPALSLRLDGSLPRPVDQVEMPDASRFFANLDILLAQLRKMGISPAAVSESDGQTIYRFYVPIGFRGESTALDMLVEERQLEFLISKLYTAEKQDLKQLLEAVNKYNQIYCGVTVWVNPDTNTVSAKCGGVHAKKRLDVPNILRLLRTFLSVCDQIAEGTVP
ncbi:hypothetical protein [Oscillibacter sp.]|uniref:hypothetical protein n=1 Tax=Oscillibacter sp. TaxID=1945593 RepID=UPI00289A3302|nr:hypothetical protein [Oscillibacter sp.]